MRGKVIFLIILVSIINVTYYIGAETYSELLKRTDQLYQQGKLDDALTGYTKAIELEPMAEFAYSKRALVLDKMKNFNKALDDISKAISIKPRAESYSIRCFSGDITPISAAGQGQRPITKEFANPHQSSISGCS